MRIEYIREFVDLAQTLSFTKTAKRFFISQSTLSKHMSAVERELGVVLVQRDSHGASLTEAGELALQRFSKIVDGFDRSVEDIRRTVSGTEGTLRIGFHHYAGITTISRALETFSSAYPRVAIECKALELYELSSLLDGGVIDIALGTPPLAGGACAYDYIAVEAFDLMAFVSRSNPLARREGICLADLESLPMVFPGSESDYAVVLNAALSSSGFEPSRVYDCKQLELASLALKQTGGFFFGAQALEGIVLSDVVALPLEGCPLTSETWLARRRDSDVPWVERFMEIARKTMRKRR